MCFNCCYMYLNHGKTCISIIILMYTNCCETCVCKKKNNLKKSQN